MQEMDIWWEPNCQKVVYLLQAVRHWIVLTFFNIFLLFLGFHPRLGLVTDFTNSVAWPGLVLEMLYKNMLKSAWCSNLKINSALFYFVFLMQCSSTCNFRNFIRALLIELVLDLGHSDLFYFCNFWNCKYSCSWTPWPFDAFCELKWSVTVRNKM